MLYVANTVPFRGLIQILPNTKDYFRGHIMRVQEISVAVTGKIVFSVLSKHTKNL